MERWQNIWELITTPAGKASNPYEKEQATGYSALLFLSIPLLITISILLSLNASIDRIIPLLLLALAVAYSLLYIIAHKIDYRWSARLYVPVSIGIVLYSFNHAPPDNAVAILFFAAIPIMIGGFILPRREVLIYLIVAVILIIGAESLHPEQAINIAGAPLMTVLSGLIAIITSSRSEHYHRLVVDSETRYRSLMEANYEGIIIIDKDTAQILDVNPAVTQMLGYNPDEMLGRYPVQFVHDDDQALTRNAWENRIENVPFEVRMPHKQGYELIVESRLRPYYFQNQVAYVLTLLDITDRKQSENLIIESEERFRAIFNGSIHYVGVLDNTGKILEYNDSAYEKFGFSPRDVLGKYLHEFDNWAHSETSKERIKEVIALATNGIASRYNIQARDKDGETLHIDFSVKPIRDVNGNVRMIIAESLDTTAYHHADAQRREYEQRYQSLFKDTIDAVFIYTLKGQFLDANKKAEEILGIPKEEIIKHTIFDFVAPQDKAESSKIVEKIQQGQMTSVVPERLMMRANGEKFYAETHGMVVTDGDGKPRYIQSMVRDISERKRLEEERFMAALEQERTRLLAHFIENASHHFRTPITNMKTRMYLLPRVLDNPEKREEQIDILNQELDRLQNILSDLLSVLRLQKDDTEYSPGKTRINQLISEVRQTFEGRNSYQNHQWQWQLNEANPVIFGDKGRLAGAIINIIENAITYTPADGAISIRSFTRDDFIAIDIIDSGRGISPDELPHIFDDFYRGYESMEQDSTGSGLGLTIAKMVIQRHKGAIYVTSPERGGTHFQIVLPVHQDSTETRVPLPGAILEFNPGETGDA